MATPYFTKFPQITYNIDGTPNNNVLVLNIIHNARFIKKLFSNLLIFYPYHVKEGETPEIIASKLYGSPLYFWVVCLANNIYNIWTDWPLSYEALQAWLIKNYGSVAIAQTTVDHYQDQYGATIDYQTYLNNIDNGATVVYADQQAYNINEGKKLIRLVDPKYVTQIENELDQILLPSTS